MTKVLYLAQPIDYAQAWVDDPANLISRLAMARGWGVYRPAGAWAVSTQATPSPVIEEFNRRALHSADALAACLPAGIPSIGVPREIEAAVQLGIPVLVSTTLQSWSLTDVTVLAPDDAEGIAGWLSAQQTQQLGKRVQFVLDEGGRLPSKAYPGDAGFDLYVSVDTDLPARSFTDVACGLRAALPPGVWGRITGRSSTLRKKGLLVAEGVIDTQYRGPLFAGVWNQTDEPKSVVKGERLAQLILHTNVSAGFYAAEVDPQLFERLPGGERGESGFGSSGA